MLKENYTEGVRYHADYDIAVPKYGQMQVKIRVTQFYSGGGKTETRVLLVLSEPLDSFTSEINIITADSKGKTIIKTYEGYSDRK